MTCRDMDEVISSGLRNAPLGQGPARHLAQCEACRHLIQVFDEGATTPILLERQMRRIQVGIVDNLKPVRPLPAPRFFLCACATVFLGIVALGTTLFGMNGWCVLTAFQRFAVFVALAISATLLTFSMVGQMVPGSKQPLAPVSLPVTILCTLLTVIATIFRPQADPEFVANGVSHIWNVLSCTIPAAFLFWLLLRRGAILYPKLAGASAGTLAGLIGLTALEFNCPNVSLFHILVWHWGVVLISTGAGVLLGAAADYLKRIPRA